MNYWLLCLPRADIENCIKVGTFGLNKNYNLKYVGRGDRVVCCAGRGDWKIVGVGEAISTHYIDDRKIFLKDGIFPDRIDFKAEKLNSKQEVDIIGLLDQLNFVTNRANWAVYFRNGVVKLSKADWELITSQLAKVQLLKT